MKRTQIMLEPRQYRKLSCLASQTHKSMGELIRDAVDKVYKEVEVKSKADIVKKISKMNLPVSSWEDMEKEVEGRLVE